MRFPYLAAAALAVVAGCSGSAQTTGDMTARDLAGAALPKTVVINEVFPHGADVLTDPDWVELKNVSDAAVDLSGYRVRDDKTSFTLPAGTTLDPGKYLVLLCDDQPDGGGAGLHLPFKLGGSDEFYLQTSDGTKVDGVLWTVDVAPTGKSYGRLPDGTGSFSALNPPRGSRNGV